MMFLIFILVYSIISAYFNYEIITRQDWHVSQALLRIFTFGAMLLVDVEFSFYTFVIMLFQGLVIYWVFFDLFLNLFRGKPLFYIGHTSKIDIFFSKLRTFKNHKFTLTFLMYFIKLAFLTLTIYLI